MHNAVIIRHIAFEDLGTLEEVLVNVGYQITYIDAGVDDLERVRQSLPELLVILGGPISVYDQSNYPFLLQEIELLKERIEKNLPTLGICLGAQLLAVALGGQVFPGSQKEIGWSKIHLTERGQQSCFRYFGENEGVVLHWHGDTFTLPEHATLHASTEKYENQAFSVGPNILAIQFHPEVDERTLEKWFIGHACEITVNNISLEELRKDTKKYAQNLKKQAQVLFTEWLSNLEKNYMFKQNEQKNISKLWQQEYNKAGIPSSYRTAPSSVVSSFLFPYLTSKGRSTAPGVVADLGCGLGRNSFFFAEKNFDVWSLDIVPENIQQVQAYAQKNNLSVTAICGDITEKLPFPDKSIDIIIDVFCYKHQTEDNKREFYRKELCRVLKDDGYYLLSLAGKDDGYYGQLRGGVNNVKIIDPHTQVGSVLFDPEDIQKEFEGYALQHVQTVKKEGLMHEETYLRITHAFIMQKDLSLSHKIEAKL